MTQIHVDYDTGYFDKDEQGWCARRVQIRTEGGQVIVRSSGDDNGARPYDTTQVLTLGRSWPELGLVALLDEGRVVAYFAAKKQRLRSYGEQVLRWFKPPAGYRGEGCLERAAELVAPVAEVLGLWPGAPPRAIDMPPRAPSPTSSGAVESKIEVPGEGGAAWRFMLREMAAGWGLGPQLEALVRGEQVLVSLFVEGPERAMFLFSGALERYPEAAAARDRAIAEWLGEAR